VVDLRVLEAAGSLLFTVALVPQLVRTLQRKRAKDVDLTFLLIVLLASGILLGYSFATRQYWYAGSYVANLLVWSIVLYYRLWPAKPYIDPNA
jgi:uncharacterized protein with PQ loop repeat